MKHPTYFLILFLFYLCVLPSPSFANKYSKKANEDFVGKEDYRKYDKKKNHERSKNEYDRGGRPEYDKRKEYEGKRKEYDERRREYDDRRELDDRRQELDPRKLENDYAWQERKTSLDSSRFVDDPNFDIRRVNKPFRVAKLNLLWTKAQSRLTEPKLKSIFSELKMHDKEELAWKRLSAEGKDKDGLLEAGLRKKLSMIMNNYGLLEHFEDIHDYKKVKDHEPFNGPVENYLSKNLFVDKKLNKLWEKAEHSGFTAEELQILREEFTHHQEKVDQYFSILNDVGEATKNNVINSIDDKHERFNELDQLEDDDPISKDYLSKVNLLRDKHKEIRDDYDRLYRLAMSGPNSQEFTEPRVQGLWKVALKANFTPEELDSLKVELFHYEKRLLKLRRLHVDAVMEEEQRKLKGLEKVSELSMTDDLIKRQSRKVAKMHLEIESRILSRHTEL